VASNVSSDGAEAVLPLRNRHILNDVTPLQENPRISLKADKDFFRTSMHAEDVPKSKSSSESQTYGETNDNQDHQRSISSSPRFQYPNRLVSFLREGERDAHPGAGQRILQR
jgi:hypothetical protein